MELVVASHREEGSEPGSQGVEDLNSGVLPYLIHTQSISWFVVQLCITSTGITEKCMSYVFVNLHMVDGML